MPVNETIELAGGSPRRRRCELAAVIVNRVLPELFGRSEEEVFDELCRPENAAEPLRAVAGGDVEPVLEAARLAVTMRRTAPEHLERLRGGIDPGVPDDLPAVPLHPVPRAAHHSGRWPSTSARSWASDTSHVNLRPDFEGRHWPLGGESRRKGARPASSAR